MLLLSGFLLLRRDVGGLCPHATHHGRLLHSKFLQILLRIHLRIKVQPVGSTNFAKNKQRMKDFYFPLAFRSSFSRIILIRRSVWYSLNKTTHPSGSVGRAGRRISGREGMEKESTELSEQTSYSANRNTGLESLGMNSQMAFIWSWKSGKALSVFQFSFKSSSSP